MPVVIALGCLVAAFAWGWYALRLPTWVGITGTVVFVAVVVFAGWRSAMGEMGSAWSGATSGLALGVVLAVFTRPARPTPAPRG